MDPFLLLYARATHNTICECVDLFSEVHLCHASGLGVTVEQSVQSATATFEYLLFMNFSNDTTDMYKT